MPYSGRMMLVCGCVWKIRVENPRICSKNSEECWDHLPQINQGKRAKTDKNNLKMMKMETSITRFLSFCMLFVLEIVKNYG